MPKFLARITPAALRRTLWALASSAFALAAIALIPHMYFD